MFIKPEAYKVAGKYSYPDPKVSPAEKKQRDWLYQYANAFWSEYVQNKLDCPYTWGEEEMSFDELRLYAKGKQSMEKLKDRFRSLRPNAQGKRTTKMNISWRGMDFMAKQFDVMRAMNQEVDFDIEVSCSNTDDIDEKDFNREYVKYMIHDETAKFLQRTGYKPVKQGIDPNMLALKTNAQVDLYFDSGGFPLMKEIKLQAAIEKSLDIADFAVIKDMIFDDLITLAKCGVKTEINNATLETTPRYVDMKYALLPHSTYLDYRNINRAAELRFMTIAELKEEDPTLEDSVLMQLAKDYAYMNEDYANIMGSQGMFNLQYRMEYKNLYGVDPMLNCKIMVLDGQFISPDYEKYVKTTRLDSGNDEFYQVDNNFDPDKWTNRKMSKPKVKNSRCFRKYEFKWVVGTKIFLKGGLAPDVIYDGPDGNLKPKLDFRFYKTGNKSIIERCIAFIDDMNLALFKKRNALKTLPPAPRMIINEMLLSNVMLNGIVQEPEDLIRTLEEKGYLVVKTQDDFQRNLGGGKMVDFIPSGIIEDLTMFSQEIETQKNNIREVTGVNQIADASTPDPEEGLGKSKLAISATNHALYPTFKGYKSVFERTCLDIGDKTQLLAKKKDLKIAHRPFGQASTKVLVLGSDVALSKFNYKCRLKSSDEDKRMMLQEITGLKQQRRANGGFGGITGAQYLFLYDRIMAGQVKLAMYMLSQMEADQLEQDNQEKANSQKIAAQFASQQAQQNQEADIATESAKEKEKRKTILLQSAMDRKTKIVDNVLRAQSVEGATQILTPEQIIAMIQETDQIVAGALPTDMELKQQAAAQQQQMAAAAQQAQGASQAPDPNAQQEEQAPGEEQEQVEEPAIQ